MQRILAVLLSVVLSLAAAEVLLRTFAPRRTINVLAGVYPAMFEDSDYLPYRLRRGYRGRLATDEFDTIIRINSRGYRGDEFAPGADDAFRILVIGDSFTFGWGVEDTETYASRLQQLLLSSGRTSRRVEVVNAGFAACYSPDTYYLYMKREGLALDPDLIVVGVYVGNDLDSPAAFENEWVEHDAEGLPLRIRNTTSHVVDHMLLPRVVPLRYRIPVLHRLHLFQGIADLWWALKGSGLLSSFGAATTLHAAGPTDDRVPFIYRLTYAERTNSVMNRVTSLFGGMKRLASEAEVPLVFMIIPEQVQLSANALDGLPADVGKPQRLLSEFFKREGLDYVDLLPSFAEATASQRLYVPKDGHWSVAGHSLGAQRLAEALVPYLAQSRPSLQGVPGGQGDRLSP
jgi:SGNH hydrolase-like domain, acetyltransferase AlgX